MLTKLQKIQIRYYPPGINLLYSQISLQQGTKQIQKQLDLYQIDPLQLSSHCPNTNSKQQQIQQQMKIEQMANDLIQQQQQILKSYKQELKMAIKKILNKYQRPQENKHYKLKNCIKVHVQPLTNCIFSKYGDKFATASYDRTCRIWQTKTGNLLTSLKGHRNAVFCLDISRFSQQELVATGSLDHTARICNISGTDYWVFKDHTAEVTSVKFNPNGIYLATSSFDSTIKIWDIEKGKKIFSLQGHSGQVIKVDHNYNGDQLLSCSFDSTARLWDLKSGTCIHQLTGHTGQINSCKFEYTGQMCATGSNDKTCIIWDVSSGQIIQKLQDHQGQIYDIDFSKRGSHLLTCSSDSTAKVYDINTLSCLHTLKGHQGQVTRAMFNPPGNQILTTGYDGIARVWDTESGKNVDLLQNHKEQIFSCDIDYYGKNIITCSKDNICNVWELQQ